MIKPKVVLLIFVSGKIVITGAKVREEIYTAFNQIYTVLAGEWRLARDTEDRRLKKPWVLVGNRVQEGIELHGMPDALCFYPSCLSGRGRCTGLVIDLAAIRSTTPDLSLKISVTIGSHTHIPYDTTRPTFEIERSFTLLGGATRSCCNHCGRLDRLVSHTNIQTQTQNQNSSIYIYIYIHRTHARCTRLKRYGRNASFGGGWVRHPSYWSACQ